MQKSSGLIVSLSALLLTACGDSSAPDATATGSRQAAHPADEFLARLASHCGQAFEGRVVIDSPPQDNDLFSGRRLLMHVRECSAEEVRVPFHVGEDHSRTWILTRTDSGLRLKHDHRHEDGTDDTLTFYGGDTESSGSAIRQEFPVDEFSIAMFEREGRIVSTSNVWAMEIEPGVRFLYELSRRAEERLFQVEFDLSKPVTRPPTPWGHPPLPGDGEP